MTTEERRGVIPILTYHSLDPSESVISMYPERFSDQMDCLAEKGWHGTTLRDAVEKAVGTGEWPDRTVVLTFDDGYENIDRFARPVLARHGFAATVFLVTRHVGGENSWAEPPSGLGTQRMLGWDQVSDLERSGWEIGAHTLTHPDLTRLSEKQLELEIRSSRVEIEDRLGATVTSFAYPFGYTSTAVAALVARHFQAACTVDLRRARREALHLLPRIDTYYVRDPRALVRLLSGSLDAYLAIRRLGRRIRAAMMD